MDKIERLMRMMEHPEQYTSAQWQGILSDADCLEYYQLMSKTDSAVNDDDITDEDIDGEWKKLEAVMCRPQPRKIAWRKIAAAVIGFVLVSGIAIAAVTTDIFGFTSRNASAPERQSAKAVTAVETKAMTADTTTTGAKGALIKQFDDATLASILDALAAYYHVTVDYRNADVRKFRLFYQWDQANSIEKVVEQLNNFEKFHISIEGRTLTVD